YYYLRVHLKANHLSMPDERPFDRYNDMMEWRSELAVPWQESTAPSPYRKAVLTNLATSDRSELGSNSGQDPVTIEAVNDDSVELRFETNEAELLHYQIRERRRTYISAWRDHLGSLFEWRPGMIPTTLEVRAVNVRSVAGPVAVAVAQVQFHRI